MTAQTVFVGQLKSISASVAVVDVHGVDVEVPLSELGTPNTPLKVGTEVAVPSPMNAPAYDPDDPAILTQV